MWRFPRLRKLLILLAIPAFGFALASLAAFIYAWHAYNGAALGAYCTKSFNKSARGRSTFGSVEWSPRAVIDLLLGRDHPVVIRNWTIYDSRGQEVAHIPRVVAYGKLWPLLWHGDFQVSRAEADEARVQVDWYPRPEGVREPSGELAHEVGILGAFESRLKDQPVPDRPSTYVFRGLHIRRLRVVQPHPHFHLELRQIEVWADLYIASESRRSRTQVRLSVRSAGGAGDLTVRGQRMQLTEVASPWVLTDPLTPADLVLAVQGRLDDAPFRVSTRLRRLISPEPTEISLDLTTRAFGHVAGRFLGIRCPPNGETARFAVRGLTEEPHLHVEVQGLAAEVPLGDRTARLVDGSLSASYFRQRYRLARLRASLDHGDLFVRGSLAWLTRRLDLRVRAHDLPTAPWLADATHRELLAGQLTGGLQVQADLDPRTVRLTDVDLSLRRSGPLDLLPRTLTLRGAGAVTPHAIQLAGTSLTGAGLRVAVDGGVDRHAGTAALAVQAQASRLHGLFARLRLPPLAHGLSLSGTVTHAPGRPGADLQVTLDGAGHGALRARRLASRWTLENGTLALGDITGDLAGGRLQGEARIGILRPGTLRIDRFPRVTLRAGLADAALARLWPGSGATGTTSIGIDLHGRPGAWFGAATLDVRRARILGQRIARLGARARLERDRVLLESFSVRGHPRGAIRGEGQYHLTRRTVGLQGEIDGLPLDLLAAGSRTLGGQVDGHFHVQGPLDRPLLEAALRLTAARVGAVVLGKGHLRVENEGRFMRITGRLFERFTVKGTIRYTPAPVLALAVEFSDVPVEQFAPDLVVGPATVTGRASGRVALVYHLSTGALTARAELSRLVLQLRQKDPPPDEAPATATLRSTTPVRLDWDGKRLRLDPARFEGSLGELEVRGDLTAATASLRLFGRVDLAPLAFLVPRRLEELSGSAFVDAALEGPRQRPALRGTVRLAGVVARPRDRRVPVRIASAELRVTPSRITIVSSRVAVQTDELSVVGSVALRDGRPHRLDLTARGRLGAEAIDLVMPRTFSNLAGSAKVTFRLTGPPDRPELRGWADLQGISFTLRGASRTYALQSGKVEVADRRIRLLEVRGAVDDGAFQVDGAIRMKDQWPWDMDLQIRGQSIPIRKSRAYELELHAALRFVIHEGRPRLTGQVDVADGRYIEAFDVVSSAFLKRRATDGEPAPWETDPTLRRTQLNVNISTHAPVLIKNNLADIELEGHLTLLGTPLAPRFGGRVQAETGTFRIPFLRGEYAVESGEIDFDHPFGFGEAYVKIVGGTAFTDSAETEHDITLTLEGPVSKIAIKLTSSTGLNQSQIIMLLASGRSVDSIRRQAKRSDLGPGGTTRSQNPLDAYDSSIKQVTGDFLTQLVAKPLQQWTKLDLVRLEMGTESFQLRVNKSLGRYVRLAGEAEMGLMGRQRQEGRIELRITDQVGVNARARRLIPGEDTVVEEDRYQGRLEIRYKIDLQARLKRALGF
jgi:hypothetical protein